MKERFDIGSLDSGALAERAGTRLDGYLGSRLDLWCDDLRDAMGGSFKNSAAMARSLTDLWGELGTIWPDDGSGAVRTAQAALLQDTAASKGFVFEGSGFPGGVAAALDDTATQHGREALYRLMAGSIKGDGTSRDAYGREITEDGRLKGMSGLTPGRYLHAASASAEEARRDLQAPAYEKGAWDRLAARSAGDGTQDGPEGPEAGIP